MEPIFRMDREIKNYISYETYSNDRSIYCFHSQIELYFIDEGEMDMSVNYHHQILKAGQMSVALSFDAHKYSTPSASKSSVLFIPVHMCPDFIEEVKHRKAQTPFITDEKVVKEIKKYAELLGKCAENSIKIKGYVYVILGIIMENLTFQQTEEVIDTKLSLMLLDYISNNFAENITLHSTATEFGYNASYISRYFKSCFNIGFYQYLTSVRLKNALMLMNEKKYTLTHCAMESGFNSLRTFHRAFKKEFYCTPAEYIKKL